MTEVEARIVISVNGLRHVELLRDGGILRRMTLCGKSPLGWEIEDSGDEPHDGDCQACRRTLDRITREGDAVIALPDRSTWGRTFYEEGGR